MYSTFVLKLGAAGCDAFALLFGTARYHPSPGPRTARLTIVARVPACQWVRVACDRDSAVPNTARGICSWPRGVTVSTLDSESSDRGSNPREASFGSSCLARLAARSDARSVSVCAGRARRLAAVAPTVAAAWARPCLGCTLQLAYAMQIFIA